MLTRVAGTRNGSSYRDDSTNLFKEATPTSEEVTPPLQSIGLDSKITITLYRILESGFLLLPS